MKFIRKPSPPFEAFQWFKLGDGPAGVVKAFPISANQLCPKCEEAIYPSHGYLNNFRVCPGDWIAEITPGEWKRFTPAAFKDFCIPVIDVDNLVFEILEKLGFSGLKSENPIWRN